MRTRDETYEALSLQYGRLIDETQRQEALAQRRRDSESVAGLAPLIADLERQQRHYEALDRRTGRTA